MPPVGYFMRLIALEVSGGIALLVFLTMLVTIARHRAQSSSQQARRRQALAEHLWAIIPWLMMISSAVPAARQIVTSSCTRCARAPAAALVARASRADGRRHSWSNLLKAQVVIDQQQSEQR